MANAVSAPAPLVTNHGHVLLAIAANPDARLRDIAVDVDVTERTVMAIVADLERDGYITREKLGRRNHYTVNSRAKLRHPREGNHRVADLLGAMSHTGA